ncbi:sugar transferase [Sulfobacillus thermosulfidooxidans]|uniref:sugar transferase n=1 Tax=Sulfobacillus thermosulfidooxidans TaxID=28034 RepID=UPI00096B9424|nr:sugar transferase [Sulfobacillus thermosulfidooxidans]OLZ09635.1 exopolysaccharide biosynthesis polyprenyl glycosylphosphotransferase [Sulfobacillus thermosulfidooxidans]OLZ16059.1 exopolysaccharide biosynthesis polyprenyl glycosylphosphotransferase [Sulfobacillus thermosulfidooxidans]OLZ18094.1 exopolysaccharide biosynthesis polyprenyl glycosylphosphotransferase [Sulfobacillus thermosulfidooxidans]
MKRWVSNWALVALIDILVFNGANLFAFLIRFAFRLPPYNLDAFIRLFPFETISLLVLFYFYGLYDRSASKTSQEVMSSVVTAIIVNTFFATMLSYMLANIGFPRTVFFISAMLQVILFLAWRLMYRSLSLRTAPSVHVMVVGPEKEWPELTIRAGKYLPRIRVHYRLPHDSLSSALWPYIGAVILGNVDQETKSRYFIECMTRNIPCLWKPNTYDLLVAGSELTSLGETPMFSLASIRTRHGSAAVKRLADITVSFFGLVTFFPILLLIGLIILIDSGRPILYRQERITAGGRHFMLVKFRTMIPDAEKTTGPVLAKADDPRITRFGKFLRATHLDELPQLWNILKGDMSLVGPRPERPIFVDQHRRNIAFYELRHLSTPGLTGLAQVAGSYTSTPEEKATYDLAYAKTWSWLKDLSIVIRTIIQIPFKKDPS